MSKASAVCPTKIGILGDGGVGKSALLHVKTTGIFDPASAMTIGVNFACVPFEEEQKKGIFLTFDLGGQKRFQFIHDSYIKGIKMAVIMYDLTRYSTFENIPHWIKLALDENEEIPVIFVGSKKDLVSEEHIENSYIAELPNILERVDREINVRGHFFISSKTSEGIEQFFSELIKIGKAY